MTTYSPDRDGHDRATLRVVVSCAAAAAAAYTGLGLLLLRKETRACVGVWVDLLCTIGGKQPNTHPLGAHASSLYAYTPSRGAWAYGHALCMYCAAAADPERGSSR